MSTLLRIRLAGALRAARDFLRGFVGMPSARLETPGDTGVRRALEARAGRRRSCC